MTAARPRGATLRVAAPQAASVPGDVDANVATAVSFVASVAESDVRVFALSELFLTGYGPAAWLPEATLPTGDGRLAPLKEAAARYDVVVVAGAAVRRGGADPGPVTLTLGVVDPRGGRGPWTTASTWCSRGWSAGAVQAPSAAGARSTTPRAAPSYAPPTRTLLSWSPTSRPPWWPVCRR